MKKLDSFVNEAFPALLEAMRENAVSELGFSKSGLGLKIRFPLPPAAEEEERFAVQAAPESVCMVKSSAIGIFHGEKNAGDAVAAQELLGTVEAMGLRHEIKSPAAGTVAAVCRPDGSVVDYGALLFELSPNR